MKFSKKTITREWVEKRFLDAKEQLEFFLENLESSSGLTLIISTATDVASCGTALNSNNREILDALRIAGHASAALFDSAAAETSSVEISIGDKKSIFLKNECDKSVLHAGRWIRGFWFNAICREYDRLEKMCISQTQILRESNTKGPEYSYLFVDALKSFWDGQPDTSKKILRALEATDPERDDVRAPDWTLYIDVPVLQLLFYVHAKDEDFALAFPKAVELHSKFWSSSSERKKNWEKFLSIELTGLAALACDREFSFEFDSEIAPKWLYLPNEV